MTSAYSKFVALAQSISDLAYASGVLAWDQETYMPAKGANQRARQLSTLAGLVHEKATSEELGLLLEELEKDTSLTAEEQCNVQHVSKQYRKAKKYSREFVMTVSRTVSEAFNAWHKAKKENDFTVFAPLLERLVALKREECELLGYIDHPYDALLEEFEPGLKTADVAQLFADVRRELVPFVKAITTQPMASNAVLRQEFAKDDQFALSEFLLRSIGFDFEAGRQDISIHPFTTNFGAEDVRVTTRIDEHDLSEMMTGTIHEGGHALYEQGLPAESYGLPVGEYVTLGIHESQSRLWENNVGRSLRFSQWLLPELKQRFPEQFSAATPEVIWRALNVVRPSFVRIAADELTYHFHIMVRFETEKALIEGSLQVSEVPVFWNSRIQEYLGLEVPDAASGCLQDVHWSHGSFGYFPTYSIGSFYAAQLFAAAEQQIDGLHTQLEHGEFAPLREWLRVNIHQHGKRYTARELCERITGEPLTFRYFMDYARSKYNALYSN